MHLQILMKPASGSCNMACQYCFYSDETKHRQQPCRGMMTLSTLEQIVRKAFALCPSSCSFAFQGGEPTLRGLDFFEKFIVLEKKYNTNRIPVMHLIQTNGFRIDRRWAVFLKEHNFLVGLSLDGTRQIHDRYRLDRSGKGTYDTVLQTAKLLQAYQVDFNVLTVVTKDLVPGIRQIYQEFMKQGFVYQQYVPCLDPLEQPRGTQPYSLTPDAYEQFLKDLFDVWLEDRLQGNFIYIRYFEDLLGILLGARPNSCEMQGNCSQQLVIEADGSVYPCDFYMTDQYCMGNIRDRTVSEFLGDPIMEQFIRSSWEERLVCGGCRFRPLCNGGCKRERETFESGGQPTRSYYCESRYRFFTYAVPKMIQFLEVSRR